MIKLLPEADNLFDLFRLYGEGDEMPTNTVDDFLEYKVVWHEFWNHKPWSSVKILHLNFKCDQWVNLELIMLTHHFSSLTQWGREDGEERAAHVGKRVDELPLQEGHESAQCVEVRLAKVIETLHKLV